MDIHNIRNQRAEDRIDFDGRKTESYYLVWLPDGWEEQEIKKGHN